MSVALEWICVVECRRGIAAAGAVSSWYIWIAKLRLLRYRVAKHAQPAVQRTGLPSASELLALALAFEGTA